MSDAKKNLFTYTGQVHELGPVQTFSSGFKKRELICKTKNGEYTDYAVFTAKKETADKIATLKPGDHVSVTYVLDGHEWDGPNGKRWFGGATAIKVELAAGVNAGQLNAEEQADKARQDQMTLDNATPDDFPF